MKLNEIFEKRYVSADDLQGKTPTLEIVQVQPETMYHPGKRVEVEKWVIRFAGCRKGVVMSKTLGYQIAGVIGSEDTDDWPGHHVTLFTQPVKVGPVTRLSIRARTPA